MNKDKAKEILKNIVNEFGEEIFLNQNRSQGLISDYFASEIKTKKMIANAIRENLPKKILDIKNLSHIEKETNIGKIKYYYKEDNGLDENTANFVVESFIYALEILPSMNTTTSNKANKNYQVITSLPNKVFTRDDIKKYEKNHVVVIPYGFTKIDDSAFFYCSNLITVKIPDSVREIGWNCFSDCGSLVSIKIPYGMTSIGGNAFEDCTNLVSISIPDSVTSIGSYTFNECSQLEEVTIPDSVTSIGFDLFGPYYFADIEKIKCSKGSYAEKYLLENSLGSLIEYINNTQPLNTNKLVKREFQNKVFTSNDVKKYEKDNKVQVPYGYTVIDNLAFHSCENLTSIDIPDSVTCVEEFAFYSCRNLISINLPDTVTNIGIGAFYSCWNLSSITIPRNITIIEGEAFRFCDKLSSIRIPKGVIKIGSSAFSGCKNLTSVTIPYGVSSIGGYAFGFCESLVEITIPDSVTSIGTSAFYKCDKLKMVKCKKGSDAERYMIKNSLSNLIEYF